MRLNRISEIGITIEQKGDHGEQIKDRDYSAKNKLMRYSLNHLLNNSGLLLYILDLEGSEK